MFFCPLSYLRHIFALESQIAAAIEEWRHRHVANNPFRGAW